MTYAPIIIAYLFIILFFFIERKLRQGQEAKSWETTAEDRRSTRYVGIAFGIAFMAILVAPFLNHLHVCEISWHSLFMSWIGIVMMTLGLTLRVWAAQVLGAFYTRTLRTVKEHHVVQNGPYRLVRHPGYLGMIVVWSGAGLAVQNWVVFMVIFVVMISCYSYRIRAEELMLSQTFGKEYTSYKTKTWKLSPFLY